MKDTIVKGSGNSRSIKSVPNLSELAPTYDKLLELVTGEGLPIDLGPLNDAGLSQRGTDLNKANLLSDALCTALGLPATATPTQAMETLLKQANTKARIEFGHYKGTGKAGSAAPTSLQLSFEPYILFIFYSSGRPAYTGYGKYQTRGRYIAFGCPALLTTTYQAHALFEYTNDNTTTQGTMYAKKSADGKTISWYISDSHQAEYQLNSTSTYYYLAMA